MIYNIYGRTRVFSDRVAALTLGAIINEDPLRLKTIALAEQIIEDHIQKCESVVENEQIESDCEFSPTV